MKKADRALVLPHMQSLFDKVNQLIKDHGGLEGFQVKELTISRTHKADLEECPCGYEPIMLPSGRIVEYCKKGSSES